MILWEIDARCRQEHCENDVPLQNKVTYNEPAATVHSITFEQFMIYVVAFSIVSSSISKLYIPGTFLSCNS